jgi:hypothetical protein
MTEKVQAPAVHTKPWRHWSFAEGFSKLRHEVPEGCGAELTDDGMKIREHRSGRNWDFEPLHPDVLAWEDANIDAVRRYDMAKLGVVDNSLRTAAPRTGTFTANGYMTSVQSGFPTVGIDACTWFEAFFGVNGLMQTPGCSVAVWNGLQSGLGDARYWNVLLQPIMYHSINDAVNVWNLLPAVYAIPPQPPYGPGGNGRQYGVVNGQYKIPTNQMPGFACWGMMRWDGYTRSWSTGFYHGVASNKYANLNNPFCPPMLLYVPPAVAPPGYDAPTPVRTGQIRPMTLGWGGVTEVMAPAAAPYGCQDVCVSAVFGGLFVKRGPEFMPLNWQAQPPPFGDIINSSGSWITCQQFLSWQSSSSQNPYAQNTQSVGSS